MQRLREICSDERQLGIVTGSDDQHDGEHRPTSRMEKGVSMTASAADPGLDILARTDIPSVTSGGLTLYAEPVSTIMALLKAAGAIVSIIRVFKKDALDLDVLSPLKAIVEGIDTIIRELEALRDYIPVALDDAFRKSLTINIAAEIDQFGIVLAPLSDSEIQNLSKGSDEYQRVDRIAERQLSNALNLRGYDFPGYFAVATAALSYIAMAAVLRRPKPSVRRFSGEINAWLKACIDPANEKSAAAARNKMLAAAAAAKSHVDGHPRQVWLGSYTVSALVSRERDFPGRDFPDRPRETHFVNWYATLEGSVEEGLRWLPERLVADRNNPRGWSLIPHETDTHLRDRDESAYARCNNNLNGLNGRPGLNHYVSKVRDLTGRAKELNVTIQGVEQLIKKIEVSSNEFRWHSGLDFGALYGRKLATNTMWLNNFLSYQLEHQNSMHFRRCNSAEIWPHVVWGPPPLKAGDAQGIRLWTDSGHPEFPLLSLVNKCRTNIANHVQNC